MIVFVMICSVLSYNQVGHQWLPLSIVDKCSIFKSTNRLFEDVKVDSPQSRMVEIEFFKVQFQIAAIASHLTLTMADHPSRNFNFETIAHIPTAIYDLLVRYHYGTHFMIVCSGFLTALTMLPTFRRLKGQLPFSLYLIKRLAKTLPPLVAIVAIYIVCNELIHYPTGRQFGLNSSCAKNWWSTLLMVSNFNRKIGDTVSQR